MKNSKLVILDANVVIDAHRENYWNALINRHSVYLPATVLREEAFYFELPSGKETIDLSLLLKTGKIHELEATFDEEMHLKKRVHPHFFQGIDPGEREALALMAGSRCKDFYFCTGDRLAVKALGVLSLSIRGVSVEKLLHEAGVKKNLRRHFTQAWFEAQLASGFQERETWAVETGTRS